LGTIGPFVYHLHSTNDLTICVLEEINPTFYQLVINDPFQNPVCLEKLSKHIHFVPIEDECLVCKLPYNTKFELPGNAGYISCIVCPLTFESYYSSFLFASPVVTAYNKGSPLT
jgi:hypothetical protein